MHREESPTASQPVAVSENSRVAAVKEDAIASAETLLKFGANADGTDGDGNTPLLKAVRKGTQRDWR